MASTLRWSDAARSRQGLPVSRNSESYDDENPIMQGSLAMSVASMNYNSGRRLDAGASVRDMSFIIALAACIACALIFVTY